MPSLIRPLSFSVQTAGALADRLIAATADRMSELESRHTHGFYLPSIFAGHHVNDDTVADMIYVLGLLLECGIESLGKVNLRERMCSLIASITPSTIEGFHSYRIGESVLRLGGLDSIDQRLHEHVLAAVDSPGLRIQIENGNPIPTNYLVVAARCLLAESHLRRTEDVRGLQASIERVRSMFQLEQTGWINDASCKFTQYDIYTPDAYLFAEPMVEFFGDTWTDGLTKVLNDLDDLAHRGGAVCWGRSIGALGMAMTIELASVAVAYQLPINHGVWLRRGLETFDDLLPWFPNGIVAAHQRRATMPYRGVNRRLQMTLDLYGKFLLSAIALRRTPETNVAAVNDSWPETNRLISFNSESRASIWAFRSQKISFVLPTLFGWSSDYLPSPRSPGLFENPTSGHPILLPVLPPGLNSDGSLSAPLVPSALPSNVEHDCHLFTVEHQNWSPVGSDDKHPATQQGSRRAEYRVNGRTIEVTESLRFSKPLEVGSLSITIPELENRPIDVSVSDVPHVLQRIDTAGLAEWRSYWGEIAAVYQIEIPASESLSFQYEITPRLRIASTIAGHPYDRCLYNPIRDKIVHSITPPLTADLSQHLRNFDFFHIAWPEWWMKVDCSMAAFAIDRIQASGAKIVWTQHNLHPHHYKNSLGAAFYQLWAEAADVVIHHSHVGYDLATKTYSYNSRARHAVVPHGHWGPRYSGSTAERRSVEQRENWPHNILRLAVVGAPRREKDVQSVVNAVLASGRNDIHLVVRSEPGELNFVDDKRITVELGPVNEQRYLDRMSAFDALVLPFTKPGMLTTGVAFDCIGAGVPAITSNWNVFDETFCGADIRYGSTTEELTVCLKQLSKGELDLAKKEMLSLRPRFDWSDIAERTLSLFESC